MAQVMEVPKLTNCNCRENQPLMAYYSAMKLKKKEEINIIDGLEEARLSRGVMLGWPGAYGLVCDLGGSSMELAESKKVL